MNLPCDWLNCSRAFVPETPADSQPLRAESISAGCARSHTNSIDADKRESCDCHDLIAAHDFYGLALEIPTNGYVVVEQGRLALPFRNRDQLLSQQAICIDDS